MKAKSMRKQMLIEIGNKAIQDRIYNAGVEAALVWKLKILRDVTEISLENIPSDSSIRNFLGEFFAVAQEAYPNYL